MRGADSLVTGVILCGGEGRRMGGVDKGLLRVDGVRLVDMAAAVLSPAVGRLLVSANRHADIYGALGYEVVGDIVGPFWGPLAGLVTAMHYASSPFVATLPCDHPRVARDYVTRLLHQQRVGGAEIVVVNDGLRLQPLLGLYSRDLYPDLLAYLMGGGRAVHAWLAHRDWTALEMVDSECSVNVNTPNEWMAAHAVGAGENGKNR